MILVVCDDRWHPAKIARDGLQPLVERGFEFNFVTAAHSDLLARLSDVDTVLFTKSNHISHSDHRPWLTETHAQALRDFVRRGNRLIAVHSGIAQYSHSPTMKALLGGVFVTHPAICPIDVHNVNTGATFTVVDEHYFVEMVDESAEIFLTTRSTYGNQPGGWHRQEGKGSVTALTMGHTVDVWQSEGMQTILASLLGQ